MTNPTEVGRHRLTDTENRAIFTDRIVPDLLAGRTPQDVPTVVFLVGQPGAGKSRVTELVAAALNRHGGFVDVDSDLYKPYHPAYAALLARDDTLMATYTRADGRAWMARAEDYIRTHSSTRSSRRPRRTPRPWRQRCTPTATRARAWRRCSWPCRRR